MKQSRTFVPKSKALKILVRCIIWVCCCWGVVPGAAQTVPPAADTLTGALPADTTLSDTAAVAGAAGDTTQVAGDTTQAAVGEIKTTIKYGSRSPDGVTRSSVRKQEMTIYPDAEVNYGDINITGDTITISYASNMIYVRGRVDSTGKKVGTPVFKQQGDMYVADLIRYNFATRKAIISGVVTQQGEGYVHGKTIKKNQNDELFIRSASYTTCNLPDPHFEIVAPKIKVIPGDKLISGPFNLHIADIPTPLGFAFGIFPVPRTRSSGVVVPVYGEADTRGFFLRDGGFYWAVNDYLGMKFLGNIYTRGSWGLATEIDYRKRYAYNGRFGLRYNNTKTGIEGQQDVRKEFWVNWNHSPQTRRNGRFAVSVNAGTSSFNQLNSFNTQDYLSNSFRSSISYSNRFQAGPAQFNYGINLRQSQNTRTREVNFTLPDANLSMNRIYPFVAQGQSPKTWWQKIGFSYDFQTTNRLSNARLQQRFSLPNVVTAEEQNEELRALNDSVVPFFENLGIIWDRAQIGARHSVPVTTTFQLFNYVNVSPSFNYEEFWYLRRNAFTYEGGDSVSVRTVEGFSRAYAYSTSVAFNTRVYGIYNFGSKSKVQAIRHVINPTLSLSYRPDFSDPRFGVYQEVQIDAAGTRERLNPYQNSVYSGPAAGRSSSVGFGLNNNLEMKVRQQTDTSETFKKVSLLDNLGLNTSYNLAADSFNLSPLSMNARTRVLGMIDINLNGTIDPYVYRVLTIDSSRRETDRVVTRQRRVNQYAWEVGRGLGQLSRFTVSLSTNLNPQALRRENEQRNEPSTLRQRAGPQADEDQLREIEQNPEAYVDFNVPWNLRVSYNVSYARTGFFEPTVRQSLSFNGDLSLSEKWKVNFSSAYDFEANDFGFTNVGIMRDLHCWQMNFNWIPFGVRQSYTFDINVKASLLQDLKLSRRRSWFDR